MRKQHPRRKRRAPPKAVLRLPDLDQAKSAVLNSLTSVDAQRGYRHAIDEFVDGTALNRDSPSTEPLYCGAECTSNHVNLRRALSTCDWARCAAWPTRRLIQGSSVLTSRQEFGE
jgi:hypothetical protein